MENSLFLANAIAVILSLMVSFFAFEANSSVEFYYFGSIDDANILFVGDENVVFMCEANGLKNPTFTLTFNGAVVFDGNGVVEQNQNNFTVNVIGSCLQLTIKRLELSLNGQFTCSVTGSSVKTNGSLSSSLELNVRESPQCRDNGSSLAMVNLDCIHLRGEEVVWSFDALQNNISVSHDYTMGLSNVSVGSNKISLQLHYANGPDINRFKCSLKNEPMSVCVVENNFSSSFKTTTTSTSESIEFSSTNCTMTFNETEMQSTNFVQSTTLINVAETTFPASHRTVGRPRSISWVPVIVPIVVVFFACVLVITCLCVYFKNRNQKKKEDRHDTVNHLFGGSVQINHHDSQYDNTKARESSGEKTSVYDSIPQTINQNEAFDDDVAHDPKLNTEIPHSNPLYEASPSSEASNHSRYTAAQDKALSSDPIYDEAPNSSSKLTTLDEESGSTTKYDLRKKSSYERVNLKDDERPTSAIYATVERKSKVKKSDTKAANVDENTELSDSNPTGDHVYSYHNTGMGEDASTRL